MGPQTHKQNVLAHNSMSNCPISILIDMLLERICCRLLSTHLQYWLYWLSMIAGSKVHFPIICWCSDFRFCRITRIINKQQHCLDSTQINGYQCYGSKTNILCIAEPTPHFNANSSCTNLWHTAGSPAHASLSH